MVSFEEQLLLAENEWSNQLFIFCQQLFENKPITSHDHWHHRRVWGNAKNILALLHYSGVKIEYPTIVQTIIACYLHDTGLSLTIDENHGKASSEICLEYFVNKKNNLPEGFDSLLKAIERHEIKDDNTLNFDKEPILTILSVADDLDAFGYIGIYRYAEIYLMRGMALKDIPNNIIVNLNNRFKRLERSLAKHKDYIAVVKKEYLITRNFFLKYKNESPENEVFIFLQLINNEIINKNNKPEIVFQQFLENSSGSTNMHIVSSIVNEIGELNEGRNNSGFKPNELVIKENKLSWFAFIFLLFVIIFMYWPFYLYWGKHQTIEGSKLAFAHILLWLIPIIIIHEGLHGITWALSVKKGFKNIKFGFNKEMLAPYTHCKVPLTKYTYLIGGMSPFVLMGVIPAIIDFYLGNAYWFTIALLCMWTSAGDLLSNYHLLKVPGNFKIQDHPKKLGFILIG